MESIFPARNIEVQHGVSQSFHIYNLNILEHSVSCWFDIMICNKALKKCALLLANMLDPFAHGSHADVSLFWFFFFQQEMKDVFKSQCHERNG